MVACAPPFYGVLFLALKAVCRGHGGRAGSLAGIAGFIYLVPTFYLLAFGHGLPWWLWAVLGAFVAWGITSLIRRLVQARSKQREPQ
jgi:uncharacterized membrane protein